MAAHDLADGVDQRVEGLEQFRERIPGGRAKQVGTPHEERENGAAWTA